MPAWTHSTSAGIGQKRLVADGGHRDSRCRRGRASARDRGVMKFRCRTTQAVALAFACMPWTSDAEWHFDSSTATGHPWGLGSAELWSASRWSATCRPLTIARNRHGSGRWLAGQLARMSASLGGEPHDAWSGISGCVLRQGHCCAGLQVAATRISFRTAWAAATSRRRPPQVPQTPSDPSRSAGR